MTKTDEKPYPLGPHIPIYPNPGRKSVALSQYNPELGVTLLKIKTLMSTIFCLLLLSEYMNTESLRNFLTG